MPGKAPRANTAFPQTMLVGPSHRSASPLHRLVTPRADQPSQRMLQFAMIVRAEGICAEMRHVVVRNVCHVFAKSKSGAKPTLC